MQDRNITKGQLISYHEQLKQMGKSGDVLLFLLKSRINDFFNEYGITINTLLKERFELVAKYHETEILKTDEGKEYPSLIWAVDDKGKKTGSYKQREGVNMEDFQKDMSAWSASKITEGLVIVKG